MGPLKTIEEEMEPSTKQDAETASSTVAAVGGGAFAPLTFADGLEVLFLFDSGSNYSLLSVERLETLNVNTPLTKTKLSLFGVDGTQLHVLGKARLKILFVDEEFEVDFVILKEKDIAIVGLEDMQRMKINIDAAERKIRTERNYHAFSEARETISQVTERKPNFFLTADELLPSRSHKLVKGRIEGNLPVTEHCIIDATYAQKRYGLILPPYIAKTEKEISFLIHNSLPHAIRLKRGATIGHVSEAELVKEETVVDMDPDEGDEEHPPDRHPLDKIDLTHLQGEELRKMEKLLLKHQTAFSRHPLDIGKCPVKAPRIKLKEGVTQSIEPPRRYNANQLQELIKQTNEFNSIGVIEPSTENPNFLSQIVLASKVDPTSGKELRYARFCLDLRRANDCLENGSAYSGAVPRTVDLFDSLAHSLKGKGDDAIYAKLDISSAFFNIEIPEEDRDFFTFGTPIGNYRPTRCPFGSKFSPQAFNTILGMCLCTALYIWLQSNAI